MSQNFSKFGETFQQNRQKGILKVQRNTLTKTISWLCETVSDFGQGNVGFAAESLQPCYQICIFVSGWAIGRIVLKEFLPFVIFSDVQGTFFGFFVVSVQAWWSKLNSTSQEEHIYQEKLYRKLFVFSGTWAQFFELSLKSFRHVVKTTVYLFTGAIWERFFFESFKLVFGLWSIIVQTSGENVQQRCPNCILRVERSSRFFCKFLVMFHLTSCSSEKKS